MKVTVISHQFKKVAPAMRSSSAGKIVPAQLILNAWSLAMFSGHPDAWQGAVDVLTGNSVNLMNAIKELLKATEVVSVTSKSEFVSAPECQSDIVLEVVVVVHLR